MKAISWIKQIRVEPKAGYYGNCFSIFPKLQITYSPEWQTEKGFAIEVGWGCWGAGLRFYKKRVVKACSSPDFYPDECDEYRSCEDCPLYQVVG